MAKPTPSSLASSPATPSSSSSCSTNSSRSLSSGQNQRLKTPAPASSGVDRRKRLAANARERKRMHLLNKAYDQLRARLKDADNKSKYDVLVQAKEYIQALATICQEFEQGDQEQANNQTAVYLPASPATSQTNISIETTSPTPPVDMSIYQYNMPLSSPFSTGSTHSQLSSTNSLDSNQSPSPLTMTTFHHFSPPKLQPNSNQFRQLNFT